MFITHETKKTRAVNTRSTAAEEAECRHGHPHDNEHLGQVTSDDQWSWDWNGLQEVKVDGRLTIGVQVETENNQWTAAQLGTHTHTHDVLYRVPPASMYRGLV